MPAWRLALAGFLLLFSWPSFAQNLEVKGAPSGQFDFYVLALSWSPGFCEAGGVGSHHNECDEGRKLGFVVHGLWPQRDHGYPVFCEPSGRFPSRAAIDGVSDLYPDEGLARYEWRKHGSCSGEDPVSYFRLVRRAREQIHIPDGLKQAATRTKAMPIEIERAFAEANPGLRPDMMALSCRSSVLQEVYICLSRDLGQFHSCPEVHQSDCRFGPIDIPALR